MFFKRKKKKSSPANSIKRVYRRVDAYCDVDVITSDFEVLDCLMLDVSVNGAFIKQNDFTRIIEKGEEITLKVKPEGYEEFEIKKATVAYAVRGSVGVEFQNITPEDFEKLDAFIKASTQLQKSYPHSDNKVS